MNNLAGAYRDTGQTDRALALFRQTLERTKTKFGPDHPRTLTILNNLALAHKVAGELGRALPLYEEALAKRKAKLGPDHPSTLMTLNNLALAYVADGRVAEALPLFEEALKGRTAKFGAGHPLTRASQRGLELTRSLQRAADRYQRALADEGADHAGTLAARLQMAMLLRELTALGAAADHMRAVYAIRRRALGAEHPLTLSCRLELARTQMGQRRYAEAEAHLGAWLAAREKQQPDDWLRFRVMSLLGEVLLDQQRFAEAEPLLVRGYEGLRQRRARLPGDGRVILTEALERLVRLHDTWGKQDEAARWRNELEDLRAQPQAKPRQRQP
jgi:tetratricopeptide (TPR) repeat protein